MRIISGKYRGRKLRVPAKTDHVRPTTDRARETLFNILANTISIEEKICADLFCGSGSVGIECLSRGAKLCYFVDIDTSIVKKNTEHLGLKDESIIIRNDALNFQTSQKDLMLDFVFADPPYSYRRYDELLNSYSETNCLFVLEHSGTLQIPSELKKYHKSDRKAGITYFSFFDFSIND